MTAGLVQQRLLNQYLAGTALSDPTAVVRHLGAVQAQDFPGALWAVAQRCGVPTRAAVGAAVNSGAIIRTHVLRPTWHLVAPEDLRWMLALTGPRVMVGAAARHRDLELDDHVFGRAGEVLVGAMTGGRALTRPETAAVLDAAGIGLDGQRLVHILLQAEMVGLICSGPMVGRKQTHVLVEEWVAPAPVLEDDEAAAELAARYFTSHGPAQLIDFTWWSSLTAAQARRAVEAAGRRLAAVEVDGRRMWTSPASLDSPISSPSILLLPNYDEYVVAYRDRSDFYDRALDPQALRGGVMANVVVLDGRVVGHWSRRERARGMDLAVVPWTEWQGATWGALEVAAQAFGSHVGVPVSVEVPSAGGRE